MLGLSREIVPHEEGQQGICPTGAVQAGWQGREHIGVDAVMPRGRPVLGKRHNRRAVSAATPLRYEGLAKVLDGLEIPELAIGLKVQLPAVLSRFRGELEIERLDSVGALPMPVGEHPKEHLYGRCPVAATSGGRRERSIA